MLTYKNRLGITIAIIDTVNRVVISSISSDVLLINKAREDYNSRHDIMASNVVNALLKWKFRFRFNKSI